MDSAELDPMTSDDLRDEVILERRHLDGGVIGDLTARDVSLHECLFSDCTADSLRLPGIRTTGTRIIGSSTAVLEMNGCSVFSGALEGVRVGVLRADGSDLSVFRIDASRIDVISLRDSRMRRIEITGTRIGLLDLTNTRVREVVITGGSIDELVPSRGRVDGFDISGTRLGRVTDPIGLAGATLSRQQALELGPSLVEQLGATLVD